MQFLVRIQARYNQWANQRLYADMEKLSPGQLHAPSAANFGSILAIANHLVLADRLWINRLTGQGPAVPTVDAVPYPALADLAAARRVEEDRGLAFADALDPARLAGNLVFTTTDGRPMDLPFALCLAHFHNHQTHHRGQIHGMLGTFGVKAQDIDLLGFERQTGAYAALRP
ncbi:DinB family protein [Solidesulfovibrio carbinoliphilus subsp. oakridgensis]|uniref:DinB family protein n=1 Tax=Solidesulfovibrio carbinoliphilus subsp. oakridgensis TaxID=694327 RepID=G7QCS1_9BACT|nr:DinB family protein [Solidesulfovibrio carbinoliphilus]EHJ46227.1 DinB family protein [Solidesulfovibrio carbinoliphilus subsp. oakridgensis]